MSSLEIKLTKCWVSILVLPLYHEFASWVDPVAFFSKAFFLRKRFIFESVFKNASDLFRKRFYESVFRKRFFGSVFSEAFFESVFSKAFFQKRFSKAFLRKRLFRSVFSKAFFLSFYYCLKPINLSLCLCLKLNESL